MQRSKLRQCLADSGLVDPKILGPAVGASFRKLDPRVLIKNPVMFVVEVVSALVTALFIRDLVTGGPNLGFAVQIILWLWFTVLFANFAEAVAEGRGKAQADALRRTRTETQAKLLTGRERDAYRLVPGPSLKVGDIVLVEPGDIIPSDGEVIEGVASVNEAAITGEVGTGDPRSRRRPVRRDRRHAGPLGLDQGPYHRRPGRDLSRPHDPPSGGRRATKDAERDRAEHPARRHDDHLHLRNSHDPELRQLCRRVDPVACACGALRHPDPDHDRCLLSAIGIAGMDRLIRFNVLAMSGRAVEAAGDVDTLLLDKTGTITLGNRQATAFRPVRGVTEQDLADAAQLASLADETPEGRSIVVLAKEKHGIRGRDMHELQAHFVPFTAQTRMSGVDVDGSSIRKGAVDAILRWVTAPATAAGRGGAVQVLKPAASAESIREVQVMAEEIAKAGGTPLAVACNGRLLGVIHLKDIVKGGIQRALCRTAPHGHPHRHDHGRQPDDRRRDRRRGGGRRLPGSGHAREQARGSSGRNRGKGSWSPCAAMAPTMRRRWRRPMWVWR